MPRILVLDDEPLIAAMLAEWLAECGCQAVGPAFTAAAALRLAETEALDGAILDVSLGEGDSLRVAEVLNARGVPVAFATGYGAFDLPPSFPDAPVLAKPFDFEEIRATVARLVAGSGGAPPLFGS